MIDRQKDKQWSTKQYPQI